MMKTRSDVLPCASARWISPSPKKLLCKGVYLFKGGAGGFAKRFKAQKGAPLVTVLDPGTGKTENAHLPLYSDPASRALWKALFTELRARMKRRGLENTMMLGFATDVWPTREEVVFFGEVAPGLPWVIHHHPPRGPGFKLHGLAPVGYQTFVRRQQHTTDPKKGRSYGWRRPDLSAAYYRPRWIGGNPASAWRHIGEINISGGQRGVGRLGGDFWAAIRDKRGRRKGKVWGRYPQSRWSNLDLYTSLLAPGPEGPVATNHFEALREGVQECEARIFIERALTDDKLKKRLGADLAGRCQEALDERLLCIWKSLCTFQLTGRDDNYATRLHWARVAGIAGHYWFLGSGWQERSERLYELAGETARSLGIQPRRAGPTRLRGRSPFGAAKARAAKPAQQAGPARPPAPGRRTPESICRGLFSLASSYRRAGMKEEARQYLQKVIDTYPDTEHAEKARRMMRDL